MRGCQLTFYTQQNHRHGHQPVAAWIMGEVRQLGIRGATLFTGTEGIDHVGKRHAARFFELAEQPIEIVLAITDDEAERLLDVIRGEHVHVFYTRFPIEFGTLGDG